MKATVYERYSPPDVLELKEVEKPTPKDNEVLIKIHATTVTSGDWRARSLDVPVGFGLIARLFFGVSRPKQPILGTELAGEIESVGKDVGIFKVGDQVFAFSGAGMGCHAEYKCMSEDGAVALKPPNLTYDEAAAISFGGTTALDFFRRGKLQSGERVLVMTCLSAGQNAPRRRRQPGGARRGTPQGLRDTLEGQGHDMDALWGLAGVRREPPQEAEASPAVPAPPVSRRTRCVRSETTRAKRKNAPTGVETPRPNAQTAPAGVAPHEKQHQ